MKRAGLVRALAALLLLANASCTSGDNDGPGVTQQSPKGRPSRPDILVIGLVGTMTGPDAWRGEDAFEGADLAVHRLNVLQGDAEPPFELVTRDDRGSETRALRQIEELASLARTVGIVYAGPPEVLPRAEDALADRGVPGMLVYGDLYGTQRLTAHVFQMTPSLVWEARRIAAYIFQDRRYETTSVLASRTFTGDGAVRAMRDAIRDSGGRPARVVRYAADASGFRGAVAKLRRARAEAVVVEGTPRVVSGLTAALRAAGAGYLSTPRARLASAPSGVRRSRIAAGVWKPQLITFDAGMSPRVQETPFAGTVAAESYGRGVHYLPVPAFERFRKAFRAWWGRRPLGWQLRAYDAVRLVGWASQQAESGRDLARVLERIRRIRFGGTEVTLGPDDHTAVDQSAVGLWVVPAPERPVVERRRLPEGLFATFPWVPLARGFSIDGEELDFPPQDWRYLVRGAPRRAGPPPKIGRLRFGVATRRSDPVH